MHSRSSGTRVIAVCGVVLVIGAILEILFFALVFLSPASFVYAFGPNRPSIIMLSLPVAMAAFHFATGVGIVKRARWGYLMVKVFLYIMLLIFPVGTLVAIKGLSYMGRDEAREYFGVAPRTAGHRG